jgi:hypothetical protein
MVAVGESVLARPNTYSGSVAQEDATSSSPVLTVFIMPTSDPKESPLPASREPARRM